VWCAGKIERQLVLSGKYRLADCGKTLTDAVTANADSDHDIGYGDYDYIDMFKDSGKEQVFV
jgi:hypothetical protein